MTTKITAGDLKREAEALLHAGKMPALEDLLDVITETRKEYQPKVEAIRQDNKPTAKNALAGKGDEDAE